MRSIFQFDIISSIYLPFSCDKIKIIYSRYAGHNVINYSTENGINAMREMHYQILNFAKLNFSS